MKKYKLLIISLLLFSFGINRVNANIICNDGTVSKSCSTCTKGCCSRHGGCSNDTTDYTSPSNSSSTTNNNKVVEDKKEEPKVEEKIEEVETTNEVQEEEKIVEETEPEIKEDVVDEVIEEDATETEEEIIEEEDTKEEDLYYESKRQERINKRENDSITSFLSVAAILGVGGLIYYKEKAKKEESKNIIDKLFNRKKKSKIDRIKDLFSKYK